MVVDPVGSVKQVVKLVLLIKEAADTVRDNKDACEKLTNLVDILHAVMAPLENMDMEWWTPGMRAALTSLEAALHRAHDLVSACQKKRNIFNTLCKAGSRSKQLLRVKDDIHSQILIASFAVNVNASALFTIAHHRHSQDAGVKDSSNTSGESYSINYVEIHTVEGDDDAPTLPRLRIFRPAELEAATNSFSKGNVIGKCASATIYKGALPDKLVAIKRYPDQSGPPSIKQFVHVFQLVLEHENLVKFHGFCHAKGSEMVVEEYMPNGSLFEIINGSSRKLDWLSTIRVIRGVAQGISYLHSKRIIHLDLNPANIVFDSNMKPKISNFERSKLLDINVSEAVSHELVGTMGYMSPEYIAEGRISMMSDVFGFGVLLLHSISGMRRSILDQHPIIWAWEEREARHLNGSLDSQWCNEHDPEDIRRCMDIGLLCTQELPEDRPTLPNVLDFLKSSEMLPTPKKPRFI